MKISSQGFTPKKEKKNSGMQLKFKHFDPEKARNGSAPSKKIS